MALTVVSGPPCSGKSTYVRERAKPGDLVIDFDLIAKALGSPLEHGHADHHVVAAQRARGAAIQEAVKWANEVDVWIIDSSIPPNRLELYQRHHAHMVTLTEERSVLHARAQAERPPLWHTLIDEWTPTRPPRPKQWKPRPPHRKGTTGRPWRRFRANLLRGVTHCQNPTCGELLVDNAACAHPQHETWKGCPWHPRYPTVQHLIPLVDGGPKVGSEHCEVWCRQCNVREGPSIAGARRRVLQRPSDLQW